MILNNLIALFEREEERRCQEDLKCPEMYLMATKRDNIYIESFKSFKELYNNYEYAKTAVTGENLDAIIDCNIPLELASIIYMYTAHKHFGETNSQLRFRKKVQIDKDIKEYVNLLNNALNYLPNFSNQLVYRDIDNSSEEILCYYKRHIGKVVLEKSFISTHIESTRWSDINTGVHFIIKTAERTNARDLRKLSFNSEEQEVLFKSGTRFKIVSVDENNNVIEMEEIEKTNEVGDGIINEDIFNGQSLKILFILRETHEETDNEEDKGGWHIKEVIEKWINWDTSRIPTYENIVDTISTIFKKNRSREIIEEVAIINIKKIPGTKKSNKSVLAKHFNDNKERLCQEIKKINPDVIIFGGTAHYFEKYWKINRNMFKKERGECNYIIKKINEREVICPIVYHPSAGGYKKCIKEIEKLLKNKGYIK